MKTSSIFGLGAALLLACSNNISAPKNARPTHATPALSEATCIGPTNARVFAVYLHGMDAAAVSEQELENRRTLSRIAEEMSLRIALPRGSASCSSSVCWGWSFNDAEMGAAAAAIDASSHACFGEKPFIAIGYSNGGYLLTKLLRNCSLHKHLPRATKIFTIGSGMFRGPLEPYPANLSDCGELTMILGTGDAHNFDPSEHYLNVLRAKGANARSVQFPGGHIVPFEPTRSLLGEEIAKTLTP